jgi:hypothetical protein
MQTTVSEEQVRVLAYHMWEADGRQAGRDTHYWHQALSQLNAGAKTTELDKPNVVIEPPSARKSTSNKATSATASAKKAKGGKAGARANAKAATGATKAAVPAKSKATPKTKKPATK